MPKKLDIPKSQYLCVFHSDDYDFSVVRFNDSKGRLKYYQVQKNRRKLANYQEPLFAIRKMLKEAYYVYNTLFNL